ncbi:hypothetical protein [Porphyromonas phage phage007a_Bg4]
MSPSRSSAFIISSGMTKVINNSFCVGRSPPAHRDKVG